MNAYQTTPRPSDYLFEAGFDADFDKPVAQIDNAAIKQRAHIANGGEGEETFKCPACRGSGRFVSYAGRVVGNCFKCKGAGKIGKRAMAAVKGKATKEANKAQWLADNAVMIAGLQKAAEWNDFAKKMLASMAEWGKLTDNQVAACERMLAKLAATREAKKAERAAALPVVPTTAIEALFAKATEKLAKKAIFRTTEITIKQAPATGVNAGALYVYDTDDKAYLGKIVNGKWAARWGTKDVTAALQAVAADPTAEAIAYARKFKACCCCGKTLRAPVSVLAVVGPVCGPRWGLDHLRMAAAEMLAEEKAEEAAAEAAKEGEAK